ncbi:MAG: DeoR/GlpR transcriptional regulator [Kiritimatiellaceae bacterium]|nr:DeoR/GlpR transcriptional regulator [Kiritimatiellaceae bacterium]
MTSAFSDRKKAILDMLAEDSSVSVSTLAQVLGVSVVTIRTDLGALEEEGFIVRTHGGAMPAFHPHILDRMRQSKDSKAAIAKVAAEKIQDGDTVIISAGTTTALIAKYLLGKRNIHIVTNNTLLLTYARTNPQLRVTLVGGEFRPSEEGLVGPLAIQSLDQVFVSKAFIGVDGISVKHGFTAHLVESADLVRKMAQQAQQVYAICDSSKFGNPGFARILPFDGVDGLITDAGLSTEFEKDLREAGVSIYKAEL